jgi:hypothetical protein
MKKFGSGIRDKHPGSATLIIKNQKKTREKNGTDLEPGNILLNQYYSRMLKASPAATTILDI